MSIADLIAPSFNMSNPLAHSILCLPKLKKSKLCLVGMDVSQSHRCMAV